VFDKCSAFGSACYIDQGAGTAQCHQGGHLNKGSDGDKWADKQRCGWVTS